MSQGEKNVHLDLGHKSMVPRLKGDCSNELKACPAATQILNKVLKFQR